MKEFLRGNTGKRLALWAAFTAGLFSALALAQYFYVKNHLQETMIRESSEWADLVAADLKFTPRLDTQRLEQAAPPVPNYFVIMKSGLVLEIVDFVPGVFGHVTFPTLIPGQPMTVKSSVGEEYRILAKKVKGGTVYAGIASPNEYSGVDRMLYQAISKFGNSLDSALRTRNSQLGDLIEFAVVDSTSKLRNAFGGVPFSIDENSVAALTHSHSFTADHDHPYYLYSKAVADSTGATVAFTLIPQDVRLERALSRSVLHFNIKAAIVAWGLALALFIAHLVSMRKEWRDERLSLVEAVRQGEGPYREFKETFEIDVATGGRRSESAFKSLKTIAAFLNTDGGTLYIGIADDGNIRAC